MSGEWYFTYDRFMLWDAPIPAALCVAQALVYLVLIFVIAPLLRPTTESGKKTLTSIRFAHNVFLFLFSAVSCFGCLYYLHVTGELYDFKAVTCNEDKEAWITYLNLAFIASKVYEWLDTCFLVWSSKDFSKLNFLHVYHHATTFWLFLIVANFPGPRKMGLLLNGGVHTLMYAHYAWPFPKPLVPLITASQIAQLLYVTWMWSVVPATCGGRFADFAWKDHFGTFLTPYFMVPVYIIFFVKFFVMRFVFGTGKAKQRRSENVKSE